MKKRLFSLLTFIIMLFIINTNTYAKKFNGKVFYDYEQNGILYLKDSDGLRISGLSRDLIGDIIIPSTVQNLPVTGIGGHSFYLQKKITSITLPETIQVIGDLAFDGCTSLKAMYIPSNIKTIYASAFIYRREDGKLIYGEPTRFIPSLTDIYFGGSKDQWDDLTGGKSLDYFYGIHPDNGKSLAECVTVHFNSSDINTNSSPASHTPASMIYAFDAWNVSTGNTNASDWGYSVDKNDPGNKNRTGSMFAFRAITSQDVQQISIIGDKNHLEEVGHEIPYSYLKDVYGLYYTDLADGTREWNCTLPVYEPGTPRTFTLKINGKEPSLTTQLNVCERITVTVNGKPISFDVPPQIINGRTMIPVRAVTEAFGATVEWIDPGIAIIGPDADGVTNIHMNFSVAHPDGTYVRFDKSFSHWIGDPGSFTFDSVPIVTDGRTLVPIRAIAEVFGYKVDWNSETSTVIINSDI